MYLPQVNEIPVQELNTNVFLGYNAKLKVQDGEFSLTKKMTLDEYPMVSTRKTHTVAATLTKPNGMLSKDRLAYVDGTTLYYNGNAVTLPAGVSLTDTAKIMVSMGAYICIFPDGVYYNTADPTDAGYMGFNYTHNTATTQATFTPCLADGSPISMYLGEDEPPSPTNGDYWMDTSTSPHTLKVYSGYLETWTEVVTVYTKITIAGIDDFVKQYDGVDIAGITYSDDYPTLKEQTEALNGTHIVYSVGDDYIVVQNILDETTEQDTGVITITRKVPNMDYVIECNNRLWGCKYGLVGGKVVNEIYACALGDFKNWRQYLGTSADSYAVSIGAEGKFTGAIAYQGYPTFFKEGSIIRVYGNYPSNFQIVTSAQTGVADGAAKSLAIVGGLLYYAAKNEVMVYDGSAPRGISSDKLLDLKCTEAVAAGYRGKYIISNTSNVQPNVYVYDTDRGLWMRDGNKRMIYATATGEDDMYYVSSDKKLVQWSGTSGTSETDEGWQVVLGRWGWQVTRKKFISRINILVQLSLNATATVAITYDNDNTAQNAGTITGTGSLKVYHMHIIPHRCEYLRISISGTGDAKILGVSRILEAVNDL